MRDSRPGAHPLDREDYDWGAAFEFAGRESGDGDRDNEPRLHACAPGVQVSTAQFTRDDVDLVEAYEEGENEQAEWICLGRLKDGRWFFLRAGCDYTGWDCRSGGLVDLAPDRATLIRYGITNEELRRLGLPENAHDVDRDWSHG